MSSVEVWPIVCSHTSHVTALDTDSFDIPFKHHELTDSRKVVASSQAVLADFRSQMLLRIRLRPDSVHFDARRLSTNLQPSLCSSLALDMLFPHPMVVFTLLSTFSGTGHFIVMDKTPDTSIAIEPFSLRFRVSLVSPSLRFVESHSGVSLLPGFPASQWLSVFSCKRSRCSIHRVRDCLGSPRYHQRAVPSHQHCQHSQDIQETLPFAVA